jgi:hypothetical protein
MKVLFERCMAFKHDSCISAKEGDFYVQNGLIQKVSYPICEDFGHFEISHVLTSLNQNLADYHVLTYVSIPEAKPYGIGIEKVSLPVFLGSLGNEKSMVSEDTLHVGVWGYFDMFYIIAPARTTYLHPRDLKNP